MSRFAGQKQHRVFLRNGWYWCYVGGTKKSLRTKDLKEAQARVAILKATYVRPPRTKRASDPATFWSRVDRNGPVIRPELGPCWMWTGSKTPQGYGSLWWSGRGARAHRVAFFIEHGRWPEPMACHHCDNPGCVRASHLYEGNAYENAMDARVRGRMRTIHGPIPPRPDYRYFNFVGGKWVPLQ